MQDSRSPGTGLGTPDVEYMAFRHVEITRKVVCENLFIIHQKMCLLYIRDNEKTTFIKLILCEKLGCDHKKCKKEK